MNIFLSHAHEQSLIAERLALSLTGNGHEVFFDRKSLPPGETFDARIRQAIQKADLFIFLVSPSSLERHSYCLSELSFAESNWPHPQGHVLPVLVEPVDFSALPAYLAAITIFQPRGDVVAEVTAEIARRHPKRRSPRRWLVAAAVVLLAAAVGGLLFYATLREERRIEIDGVLAAIELVADARDYEGAWERLEQAVNRHGEDSPLLRGREDLAMRWLRDISVIRGQQTFTEIVERLWPALLGGLESDSISGQRKGDLLAHLGWAQYLKRREGTAGVDPDSYFKQSVEADPENPYGNVMWGFWKLFNGPPFEQARSYFEQAHNSGREEVYVSRLHMAAVMTESDLAVRGEAVKVANLMRTRGLERPSGDRLWSYVYQDRLFRHRDTAAFLALLPPTDHLETFLWLYPEQDVPEHDRAVYLLMRGMLEEAAGQTDRALATFRSVEETFNKWTIPSFVEYVRQAIGRLGDG